MKHIALFAAIALTTTGMPVLAQQDLPHAGGRMARLDTNKDGAIDRAEASKAPKLLEHFDLIDKNNDGRISADERPQHHGRGRRQMARLDTNKDGAIDRAEASKAPKLLEHFDRIDKNKDGRISADERPQHHGRGRRQMARLDTNKDGAIDRAEAAKAPKLLEHFDRIDKNKDGRISADERPQRRGRGGRGAKLDTDGDQRLSRLEVSGKPRLVQHFDAIDGNRDSYLTHDEIRSYREKNAVK